MLVGLAARAAVTLPQCVEGAEANFPLLKQYGIIDQLTANELQAVDRSWLPRAEVSGQVTWQNAVPAFPADMSHLLAQMGSPLKGLDPVQYRMGVDVSQTLWDGGASRARRVGERAAAGERRASVDVQRYALRERVEDLFFGSLLADVYVREARAVQTLLAANLERIRALHRDGMATEADVNSLEAEYLTAGQQVAAAESRVTDCRRLLGLLTGLAVDTCQLEKPVAVMPADDISRRPELQLYEARLDNNAARLAGIDAALMPRVGAFVQTFWGNPGLDYFKSMTERGLSFNLMAGVKLSWNIGAFNTRSNDRRRVALMARSIENEREVFLYNHRLQLQARRDKIEELRRVAADDDRIVALRTEVRRTAEARLANGVIDTTALLAKVTDEHRARLAAAIHELQILQSINQLKYTLNQ